MISLLIFLDDHSGAMIAIFTAIYVIGTLLMWREMHKSRLRLDEPNIQISLEPQRRWGDFFDLVIENLGNVPVYNLRFEINPKELKTIRDRKLEDLNLFKKSIPVFGIGEELRTFAVAYIDYIHSNQPKQFSIIAKYETKNGKYKTQKYDFDMEVYKGMSASTEKSLNEVVDQIEKLNKNLEKIVKK